MPGPKPKAAIKKAAKNVLDYVSRVKHWEDPFNKKPLVAGRKKRKMPNKPYGVSTIRHYKKA